MVEGREVMGICAHVHVPLGTMGTVHWVLFGKHTGGCAHICGPGWVLMFLLVGPSPCMCVFRSLSACVCPGVCNRGQAFP